MVKKKAKGKGKKKKKGKKEKKGMSHLEREMYLLTIEELQHKIDWKNHMCHILEEDIEWGKEAQNHHKMDEKLAVECLEEAIRDQKQVTARMELSIPEAVKLKTQTEERHTLDMASTLVKMNEEQLSWDRQIEDLGKKLKALESFSVEKMDTKIEAIERQLRKDDDEENIARRLQQVERREEAFKTVARDILRKQADDFQDEISGKQDKNFARIMEETRWWEDLVNDLRINANRQETLNEEKQHELDELKVSKRGTLKSSQHLRDRRVFLDELVDRKEQLESQREADDRYKNQRHLAELKSERLMQNTIEEQKDLAESFRKISVNESEIEALERELSDEIAIGCQMYEFIEKANELLAKEAKRSLLILRNGPPKGSETLLELSLLFEEAVNYFGNKSVQ